MGKGTRDIQLTPNLSVEYGCLLDGKNLREFCQL